jgi:hypothetical protein
MLSDAIAQLLSTNSIDQYQLWVYVFLNKRGLLETFRKVGLHGPQAGLDNFMIGFTKASDKFLMVDVGYGKEAVDAKIRGKPVCTVFAILIHTSTLARLDYDIRLPQTLKCYSEVNHLLVSVQIFLQIGTGCHDDGYATILRSLMTAGFTDKLILLKGYLDMAAGIDNLQLPSFAVPDLFRPEKIVIPSIDPGSSRGNKLVNVSPTTSPKATNTPLPSMHPPYMSSSYSSVLRSGAVPVDKLFNAELDSSDNDKPFITNSRPSSLVSKQRRVDPSMVESKFVLFYPLLTFFHPATLEA